MVDADDAIVKRCVEPKARVPRDENSIFSARRDPCLRFHTSFHYCVICINHMVSKVITIYVGFKVNHMGQGQPRTQVDPFYSHVTTNTLFNARRRSAGNIEDTPSWMLFFSPFFSRLSRLRGLLLCTLFFKLASLVDTDLTGPYLAYEEAAFRCLYLCHQKRVQLCAVLKIRVRIVCNNLWELLVSGQGKDRQCTIPHH